MDSDASVTVELLTKDLVLAAGEFTHCEITYYFKCSACDQCYTERHLIDPGGELPRPSVPFGWTRMAGKFYCGLHSIVILIDGEVCNVAGV